MDDVMRIVGLRTGTRPRWLKLIVLVIFVAAIAVWACIGLLGTGDETLRTNSLAMRISPRQLCIVATLPAITGLVEPTAQAEVKEVRLARQLGLGYLQFYVMQDQKLVEKHGAALGLTGLTASY